MVGWLVGVIISWLVMMEMVVRIGLQIMLMVVDMAVKLEMVR